MLHQAQVSTFNSWVYPLVMVMGKWMNMAHFVRSLTIDMSRNGGHRWTSVDIGGHVKLAAGSHEMMLWFVRIWSRARSSLVGNMAHGIGSCWVPSVAEKGPHRHHFPGRSMRSCFLWGENGAGHDLCCALIPMLTGPHQESLWEISVFRASVPRRKSWKISRHKIESVGPSL